MNLQVTNTPSVLPVTENFVPETGNDTPWFVYGTLLYPSVFWGVIGVQPENNLSISFRPGILRGFRRVFVPGAHFPALVSHDAYQVEGRLIFGLQENHIERLRRYEGGLYYEDMVNVQDEQEKDVVYDSNIFMYNWDIPLDQQHDWFPEMGRN